MLAEKKCCHCGLVKPAKDFGKDSRVPSGLKSRCRNCMAEYNSDYHTRHKEKLLAANQRYHQTHKEAIAKRNKRNYLADPEKHKEWARQWRRKHKAERAAYMRRQRKANPEYYREVARRSRFRCSEKRKEELRKAAREYYKEHAEQCRENANRYRQANKDKVRQWNRNRRVRTAEVVGSYTLDQWKTLCGFFDSKCPCCGKVVKRFAADHIIPLGWENTSNWITNIQPLCRSCNSRKHDVHATDYRPDQARQWALKEMENTNADS